MRAVCTLWTSPSGFKLKRDIAMLYSASSASVCRHFEKTTLVCDQRGLEIADRLGWDFTTFSACLDNFCRKEERFIWMLGKIQAQKIQREPFVGIDLDVIVSGQLPSRLIDSRVFAQSLDPMDVYRVPEVMAMRRDCGISEGCAPLNTGLIGWNDMRLKDEYCNRALVASSILSRKYNNGTLASIVAEQCVLADLLSERDVKPVRCIPAPHIAEQEDFDFKFTHVWGRSKGNRQTLSKVESHFKKNYPDEYRKFLFGWDVLIAKGLAKI